MATYVPGSSQYLPQPTAFTPDYKFLGNVLDVRTDRYNTNYQALNDLYGKVVYADLSRQDNNQIRNQYAKDIAPKIHQISDMDLSLQQNVDAAKGVFAPFFEDNYLVKDMVTTKTYQREMDYANSLLNSLDREQREKYWQTGVDAMKYQMKDFIEADREESLQMAAPQYVEDVDLYETSLKLLQDSGLFDEEIEGPPEFSPDGRWIIKTSGGAMVSKPALQYLRRSLLDDPNVQRAYYTSAYVEQRKYVDNAIESGAFNDMDQAQRAWANQTITKAEEQLAILTGDQEAEVEEQERVLAEKEQFTNKYGEAASGLTGGTMAEAIAAYDADQQNLQDKSNQLADASDYKRTSGEVPTNTLLNRAYQLMMGTNIDTDMQAAAITFGDSKKKIDIEINQYKLEEIKHQNQLALEAERHKNAKELADMKKDAEDEAGKPSALVTAASGGNDVGTRVSSYPTDLSNNAYETNVNNLNDARSTQHDAKVDLVVDSLNEMYAPTTGGGEIPVYTSDQSIIEIGPTGEKMSLEEAKKYYKDNPEAFAVAYTNFGMLLQNKQNQLMQKYPNMAITDGYFNTTVKYETLVRNDIFIDDVEQKFYETAKNNLDLTMSMEDEYEGVTIKIDKQKMPSIFVTEDDGRNRMLTKSEYREAFEEKLADGAMRRYKNLPFDGIWNKVDVGALDRDYLYDQANINAATEYGKYFISSGGMNYGQAEQQANYINETTPRQYERLVNRFANEAYEAQVEAVNKGYAELSVALEQAALEPGKSVEELANVSSTDSKGGVQLNTGFQVFNVEAALAGHDPYSGMSQMGVEVYATINAQNPPAPGSEAESLGVEYFTNMNNAPDQAIYVHSGKWDNKNLGSRENILEMGDDDGRAKQLLDQLKIDVVEYAQYGGQAKPDGGTPSFELSQSYITDEEGNCYLKYEVSPSRDWLATQKGKGILTNTSDDLGGDINKFTTVTVLIDEKNVAFKSSALYTDDPSYVNKQMNLNGTFMYDYPSGGQIKFTSNGDGTNRVSTRRYVYDTDENKIVLDPNGWSTESFPASINPDIIYEQVKLDFKGIQAQNLSIMEENNNSSS